MRRFIFLLLIIISTFTYAEEFTFTSIKQEFAAPVTTDAKYILIAGSLVTVGLTISKNEFGGDEAQSEAVENKPLGDFSRFFDLMGQMVPNALYAGWMFYDYKKNDSERSYNRSLAMTKATLYSGFVTNVLKYSIRERRPNHHGRNSFPSGHATTAFAFASVVGIEHGLKWGIPAYTLAGLVGYSRLNDNMHFTHDVVGGATIGMAYGIGLALHQEGLKKIKNLPLLTPADDGTGIKATWMRPI